MDLERLTSALLGFPIVIIVVLLGNNYVIDIVLAIIAIIALNEYYNAFTKYKPIKWPGYLAASAISCIHLVPTEQLFSFIGLAIPFIIVTLFIQLIIKDLKISIIDIAISLFGILYVVLFIMFIPLLAGVKNGKILIWYALFSAWGTDVFAYVIGKTFKLGRHKFSKVSPNKSIEGCISGLIGAVAICLIFTACMDKFLDFEISYIKVLVVSIILSIIGQFGDFAASSIKRYTGIKDFSNLIPGHGGLLDRIDSLIFIAPFAYILLVLI